MVRKYADIEISEGKPHPGRRMTETEFVNWCDEWTRAEWVDGEVILMSPDNTEHNSMVGFVFHLMDGFVLQHDLGQVFHEKVQIRFADIRRRRDPDILFVSKGRSDIVKTNHIEGPPDLVVEFISPDSVSRDYRDKFHDYEAGGVREYWIIDPLSHRFELYGLGRNRRFAQITEKDGRLSSKILRGFYIKPEWLWTQPLPSWLKILKELGVRL
jgi:Uma2 family endonuclease